MTAIRNLIVVSDLHCGCRVGLCPPTGVILADGGSRYLPSPMVQTMWSYWEYFWAEWVPRVTHHEPFAVVVNGDAVDGCHHGSKHQISQNFADQAGIAYEVLAPIVDQCEGRFYGIKGTEAHVGASGENEEQLYRRLGAIPDKTGASARYELWKEVGNSLVHLAHHIGTSGSMAYESSAVMRELTESYVEAGRWHDRAPDVVCRSHRHRDFEIKVPAADGYALGVVTGAWQLRTPFSSKIMGGRISQPQIGGICLRAGEDKDENIYCRHKVWRLERSEVE